MKIPIYVKFKLWRLVILVFCLCDPESLAQKVMMTKTAFDIQWTCFEVKSPETCCRSLISAAEEIAIPPPEFGLCHSLLAAVPASMTEALKLERHHIAMFSLTLATAQSNNSSLEVSQFIWDPSFASRALQNLENISFPFLLQISEPSESVTIHSDLSSSGGMHRLLHHKLHVPTNAQASFVFLTIPDSVFVDLDDAFEGSGNIRVHAADTCDVEQPAFVSRQLVIILELSEIDGSTVELSSKLHLRYPYPSSSYRQESFLPEPQLLCLQTDGVVIFQGSKERKALTRLWIAAGRAEDYDLVMWGTILACWIGVVCCLLDVSLIAKWDL